MFQMETNTLEKNVFGKTRLLKNRSTIGYIYYLEEMIMSLKAILKIARTENWKY